MKSCIALISAFLSCLAGVTSLNAQSTAFTYQGRLVTNGVPVNGIYDLRFSLRASASGTNPVGDPVTLSSVGITNGEFAVMLNFDPVVFNGENRWLAISVRPSGTSTFTALNPLQPITPAPYALTALNALTALSVPGLDRYSLDASDGSITDAVFVDGGGEVGIGTTEPAARLHVVSTPANAFPPRLESRGNSGFSAGWDFYQNGVGKGYVGVPDANAGIAAGELALFGGEGVKSSLWGGQVRALTTDLAGNVQVSGDLKLGSSGQFRAASGDESLRIVRGLVSGDGTILRGTGFTVTRAGDGDYHITFARNFSAPPVLVASQERGGFPAYVQVDNVNITSADVFTQVLAANFTYPRVDTTFHFIAIGPR